MLSLGRLVDLLLPRWERSNVYTREVGWEAPSLALIDDPMEFLFPVDPKKLNAQELRAVVREPEQWLLQNFSAERIAVVRKNGQILHRSLLRISGCVDTARIRKWRSLEPDETFIHACETAPSARGKGLYPFVLDRLAAFAFHDLQCNRIYITCALSNASSNRGIQKAGFKLCWVLSGLSMFNSRLFFGVCNVMEPVQTLRLCMRFTVMR